MARCGKMSLPGTFNDSRNRLSRGKYYTDQVSAGLFKDLVLFFWVILRAFRQSIRERFDKTKSAIGSFIASSAHSFHQ